MRIEDCSSFNICGAPLCPLYEHLGNCVWYPDEEICRSHDKPKWAKIQRRIAKRVKDTRRYFTVKMLESIKAVHPSTKGISPDFDATEKAWLANR